MMKVQLQKFDTNSLREWEDMLWREFPSDVLKGFETNLMNGADIDSIFEYSSHITNED